LPPESLLAIARVALILTTTASAVSGQVMRRSPPNMRYARTTAQANGIEARTTTAETIAEMRMHQADPQRVSSSLLEREILRQ